MLQVVSGKRAWLVLIVAGLGTGAQAHGQGALGPPLTLRVDVSRRIGAIRPLQGVDDGPLCVRGAVDLTSYFTKLQVPDVRLHDVPYTYDDVIDINYVFPRWSSSEDDPGNYDFVQSDYYIRSVAALHTNIIYRIGYSAEYKTAVHHDGPPVPLSKFVGVAVHTLRHYDQGWDNGYKWGIKYWEIWNEPDMRGFWSGSPEQYDRLYEATAKALKATDPSIRVGGPALALRYGFLEQFLRYCHERHVPLDFVSWHIYAKTPDEIVQRAERIHELMVRYGFAKTESILDEWNLGWGSPGTLADADSTRAYFNSTYSAVGASFDAAVLIRLQDAPVQRATFYTGTTLMWGLFTPSGSPRKPYYAFLAFRRLLGSPNRVAIEGLGQKERDLSAVAGISDDQTIRVLLSNTSPEARHVRLELTHIPWKGSLRYARDLLDDHHDLVAVGGNEMLQTPTVEILLPGRAVELVTLEPAGAK